MVVFEEVEVGEFDSGFEKKEKSYGYELIVVIVVFVLLLLGGFVFVVYSGWCWK